jgi:hypothetical protein
MTPIKFASGRTFAGFSSKKNPPKSGGSVKAAIGQIRPVSICAIYTRQGTNVNGASHTTPKTPFGGRASQNCAQRVFFSTASAIYLRFVGVSRGPALYSSVTRSLSDRLAGLRGVAAIPSGFRRRCSLRRAEERMSVSPAPQAPKERSAASQRPLSLIRPDISLIGRLNSLIGLEKFPVRSHREFDPKALM